MGREIIFRGWHEAEKRWVYGAGVHQGPGKTYILNGAGILIEVQDSSIGEWIGEYDHNGKKIFEGDFVAEKIHSQYLGPVLILFGDAACFYGIDCTNNDRYYFHNFSELFVLGNNTERPDLAKLEVLSRKKDAYKETQQ